MKEWKRTKGKETKKRLVENRTKENSKENRKRQNLDDCKQGVKAPPDGSRRAVLKMSGQ